MLSANARGGTAVDAGGILRRGCLCDVQAALMLSADLQWRLMDHMLKRGGHLHRQVLAVRLMGHVSRCS